MQKREFALQYHRYQLRLEVGPGHSLALFANDCLRKRRQGDGREPLYVWTNLELEWEEHHWVEARLLTDADSAQARLQVTINREPALQVEL